MNIPFLFSLSLKKPDDLGDNFLILVSKKKPSLNFISKFREGTDKSGFQKKTIYKNSLYLGFEDILKFVISQIKLPEDYFSLILDNQTFLQIIKSPSFLGKSGFFRPPSITGNTNWWSENEDFDSLKEREGRSNLFLGLGAGKESSWTQVVFIDTTDTSQPDFLYFDNIEDPRFPLEPYDWLCFILFYSLRMLPTMRKEFPKKGIQITFGRQLLTWFCRYKIKEEK